MKKSFLDKRLNNVGARVEVIEVLAISAMLIVFCLALPILLFGKSLPIENQLLIGPMVNCALIFGALNFRGVTKNVGVICAPSVLAVSVGLIGFMGVYAMYMIPAIWLGNVALVLSFKFFHVHKKVNFVATATIAIVAKVALIFGGFQLLVLMGAIPTGPAGAMVLGMGLYQLITATVGSVLAFGVVKALYRKNEKAV